MSLVAAVKHLNELIIDFPEILQRVRVEDLEILLSVCPSLCMPLWIRVSGSFIKERERFILQLSEFARGGKACVSICWLMADLVLLPGEPIRGETLDRIKPCLLLACDRPQVLGENVTEKCLNAIESASQNLPDLFTE